jgi:hypothetical protein
MEPNINVDEVVSRLGGPTKVAELCEMDNSQGVSNWVARGVIPKPRLLYLRTIRPDVFENFGDATEDRKVA